MLDSEWFEDKKTEEEIEVFHRSDSSNNLTYSQCQKIFEETGEMMTHTDYWKTITGEWSGVIWMDRMLGDLDEENDAETIYPCPYCHKIFEGK